MTIERWMIRSTLEDGSTPQIRLLTIARRLGMEEDIRDACRPGRPETWLVQAIIDKLAAVYPEVTRIEALYDGSPLLTTGTKEAN